MDKNERFKLGELGGLVERHLGDFLHRNSFQLDQYWTIDDGNKSIAVYTSPDIKLYIYKSIRDGEVNCLVGKSLASNKNVKDGNWYYLNSIIFSKSDFSIDELLKEIPEEPRSTEEQFIDLAKKIESNFERIVEYISYK